jgi:hypothetical protein
MLFPPSERELRRNGDVKAEYQAAKNALKAASGALGNARAALEKLEAKINPSG